MPRRARLPALLALLCLLSACASALPPEIQVVRPAVPPSLLSCAAEPPIPDAATDAELFGWVVALGDAGADCRSRLAALARIVALEAP